MTKREFDYIITKEQFGPINTNPSKAAKIAFPTYGYYYDGEKYWILFLTDGRGDWGIVTKYDNIEELYDSLLCALRNQRTQYVGSH